MIANRSPPIPLLTGSMRPSTAFVAMAASIAFPPRSRICMPAVAAMGCVAATIPYFVVITERPEAGGGLPTCGADVLWASTATARTAKVVIRITSVFFIGLEFLWKYISLDDDREILSNGQPGSEGREADFRHRSRRGEAREPPDRRPFAA